VGEPGREPAHHRQAIRPAHRLLHAAEVGKVLEDDHVPVRAPRRQTRGCPPDDALAAVGAAQQRLVALAAAPTRAIEGVGQRRHRPLQRLSARRAAGHAGDLLAGRVEVGDLPVLVGGDDAAGDGAHDGGERRLQRLQLGLALGQLAARSAQLLGEESGERAGEQER